MNKNSYFALWGGLYTACAVLGFLPAPTGFLKALLILLSIAFFFPPAMLTYLAVKEKDRSTLSLVRNLSAASLGLTVLALIANFLSLMAPEAVGNVLYAILVIISAPMVCGQYWVLGLFGWACLLAATLSNLRRTR